MYLCMNAHSGINRNSQEVETTQKFTNWWIDKQYIYTMDYLFSYKKEWMNSCYNMNELPKTLC